MKRLLSFVLVLTMLATMFVGVTAVQADTGATIKLVGATVDSNGQFDLTLTLQNDTELLSGQIGIKYDTAKLTAVSVTASDYIAALDNESNAADGMIKVMFAATAATSFATAQDVATVKFQIAEGVDYSTVAFSIDGEYTEIATAPDYATVTYTLDDSEFVLADEECLHETTTEVVTKEASCSEEGSKNIVCSACGDVIDTVVLPKLDHTEGEWIVDVEATTTSVGSKHQVCSVCGETIATEEIPMLQEDGVVDQGTCGTDVIWKFFEDGTLKIMGTSENAVMNDYSAVNKAPYHQYLTQVTKGEISNLKRVGNRALYSCYYMTEATIDNVATEIGNWVLYHCTRLVTLNIEGNPSVIGAGNFYDAKSLKVINYGGTRDEYEAIEIGASNEAYHPYIPTIAATDEEFGVSGTLDWSLKDGVLNFTGYGAMGDYNSSNLPPWDAYKAKATTVSFASGITRIGNYALNGFSNVTSITLPATLETIGNYAFFKCTALEYMKMYSNLKSFGTSMAAYCEALNSIDFLGTEEQYNAIAGSDRTTNRYVYNAAKNYRTAVQSGTTGDCEWLLDQFGVLVISGAGAMADYTAESPAPWVQYASDIKEIEIKSGVTYVGDYAFAGLTEAEYAMVPVSVNYFGNYAFANNAKLAKIDIADRLFEIREGAFSGCTALATVNYTGSLGGYGAIAVYKNNSVLDNVTVNIIAPAEREIIATGSCTPNEDYPVTWTIYADGVMVISGKYYINAYSSSSLAPWEAYADSVKIIVVEDGVRGLRNRAFCKMTALEALYLSPTITTSVANTVMNNPNLKVVALGGITEVIANTFRDESSIEKVIVNTAEGGATISDTSISGATFIYTK